jgi:hypothetical protein
MWSIRRVFAADARRCSQMMATLYLRESAQSAATIRWIDTVLCSEMSGVT